MTTLSSTYNKIVWAYHKIIEKIYWKFGYVYIPEGDMELYSNIGWDGLPFSMLRGEDKVKILAIIAFTIIFAVLYVYLVIGCGNWDNN